MKRESKHTSWLVLLRRWFSGDATRLDEQALEALAKDDPFVAEAFEGYRSLPEDDHALAMTRLKARLRQRYRKKQRGIVFYTVRIAAVGVVLVAAWLVLQQFNQSEKVQDGMAELTKKEAQLPADTGTTASDSVISGQATTEYFLNDNATGWKKEQPATLEAKPLKEEVASQKTLAENKATPPPADTEPGVVSTFADSFSSITLTDAAPTAEMEMDDKVAMPVAPPASKMADAPQSAIAQMQKGTRRHITGRVTDTSGEPLIGVSIVEKEGKSGAVTDVDGQFSLEVEDSAKAIDFSYTGYENQEIQLGPEPFMEVKMEQNAEQFSEVTVTGLSARKAKKSNAGAPAAPSPDGGFKKFEKYLRKNLHYPETAVQNSIEGTVKLRFRVAEDGSLMDFEVLNSLGAGCDEEAIRLLKEGPEWSPVGVTAYSIEFKL